MTLGELVARLPGAVLTGDPGLLVSEVTHDSRRSGPGTLFVAIRGFAELYRHGAAPLKQLVPVRR